MEPKSLILDSYIDDLARAFVQSLFDKVNKHRLLYADVSGYKFRVFDDPVMNKQKRIGIYGWVETPIGSDMIGASIDGCKEDIEPWGLPELIALTHYYISLWKQKPDLKLLSEPEKRLVYDTISKSCK